MPSIVAVSCATAKSAVRHESAIDIKRFFMIIRFLFALQTPEVVVFMIIRFLFALQTPEVVAINNCVRS